MWHPDEGTLHAWVDGALDANEAARVSAHVQECAECAAAADQARALIANSAGVVAMLDGARGANRKLPDELPAWLATARAQAQAQPSRTRWQRAYGTHWLAAAAVMLVAAGTMLTLSHRTVAVDSAAANSRGAMNVAAAPQAVNAPSAQPKAAVTTDMAARMGVAPREAMSAAAAKVAPVPTTVAVGVTAEIARAAHCWTVLPNDDGKRAPIVSSFTLDTMPDPSTPGHFTARASGAHPSWTLADDTVRVNLGRAMLKFASVNGDTVRAEYLVAGQAGDVRIARCR